MRTWPYRDAVTVSRFRPFARRRLSTRRPFFVAIRTRNPWVRLRRRRFGWNVRLPFMESLLLSTSYGETLIVADAPAECQSAVLPRPCFTRRQPYVTVRSPRESVGSPPEVFHNCGKHCGKRGERAARRASSTKNPLFTA
jgi:hypothetical protein